MSSRSEIVQQNVEILAQGLELLDGPSDALCAEREAAVSDGGAGARFRPFMDFYHAFLEALPAHAEDDVVQVRAELPVPSASSARWTGSTVGRELRFLMSHTLHRYALIAAILRLGGEPVPAGFGVALSTLRHRNEV